MATVTYINNDYEALETAMQQLVTMGYFASVEYDSANDKIVCYDEEENAVLTISKPSSGVLSITLRLDGGTEQSASIGYSTAPVSSVSYIYVCSGGAYLSFTGSGGQWYCLIISKTNNGKVGVVLAGSNGGSPVVGNRANMVTSIATNDDETQVSTKFAFSVPTTRNQTQLVTVPTCSAPNVISYFPDVYYTLTSQYSYTNNASTPPTNFRQDGKRYLWVGYFAIRDEEET